MTPRDLTDADGRPLFDLQSHSVESDGALEPDEVVARAAAAGVQLLSLTDHDSVDGVARAIAAGAEHGVGIVPGVELSTIDPLSEDLHLLGYGFDPASPVLLETLIEYRGDREARGDRMIDALKELGWQLDDGRLFDSLLVEQTLVLSTGDVCMSTEGSMLTASTFGGLPHCESGAIL